MTCILVSVLMSFASKTCVANNDSLVNIGFIPYQQRTLLVKCTKRNYIIHGFFEKNDVICISNSVKVKMG